MKTTDEIIEEFREAISHKNYRSCICCQRAMEALKKALKQQKEVIGPMGVSQWRNYGKKYGYWNYFK